jgi:hypothetical protein
MTQPLRDLAQRPFLSKIHWNYPAAIIIFKGKDIAETFACVTVEVSRATEQVHHGPVPNHAAMGPFSQ